MDSEIIAAFIGPVFTALLAGGGILIKSMQVRHREQSARARDLEVATRTVDFINTYLQAQDKVHSDVEREWFRERAKRDLEVAYQTMMATANADYQADGSNAWIGVVKRALLIGVKRTAAKVVRVFFWIALVTGSLFFAVLMATAFTDQDLMKDTATFVAVIVLCFGMFILPIVLLYVWARWLDRERVPKLAAVPTAADPVLGDYGDYGGYWSPTPQQPYGQPVPPGPPR